MSLPTYSSADVKISWGGVSLKGVAPESFVTISPNGDITDEEVGADGQVSISFLADESGTCTLVFQQQAEVNAILSAVLAEQRTQKSLNKADLVISDPSGSVLARLHDAHIKTAPEMVLSASATGNGRSWVFFVEKVSWSAVPTGVAEDAGFLARVGAAVDTLEDILAL